jgi:hypothetical protein
MMMIHPDYALMLAKDLLRERIAGADAFRRTGHATAAADCLIPVAPVATKPCRPDPRRSVDRPAGRHRSSRYATAYHRLMKL